MMSLMFKGEKNSNKIKGNQNYKCEIIKLPLMKQLSIVTWQLGICLVSMFKFLQFEWLWFGLETLKRNFQIVIQIDVWRLDM